MIKKIIHSFYEQGAMLSSFITYLCCTVWHTDPAVPQDYLWLCPELGTHSFFCITTSKVTCRVLGLNWWGVVRLINIPPHTPFLMTWKNATCPALIMHGWDRTQDQSQHLPPKSLDYRREQFILIKLFHLFY